jgi:hypothetical protein
MDAADVSPRLQRKELKSWRDGKKETESLDHTDNAIDGESLWSENVDLTRFGGHPRSGKWA